jgi:hypothetical protein
MSTTETKPNTVQGAGAQSSRPPFFICGSDRSGTTMLRLMLDRAEDGPAVPPETMFITDHSPTLHHGDLSKHEDAIAFTKKVWQHPRVKMWNLEGEPDLPPEGLTHVEAFRWGVSQPFVAYMRRDGKTWWADKTPPHIDHIEMLKQVFPDAKFIELVRDGRDVALSIMGLPFGGNNAWVTAKRWAHCIRQGRRAHERWPDDIVTVRYEDLITESARELRRVSEFVGIDYDDDMLKVENTDPSKLQADQAKWFSNLWQGINTSAMNKWKTKMTRGDQAVYLAAAGPELELHGYDLGGITPVEVSDARAKWLETTNMYHRVINMVKLRIITERGRELKWVIARRLPRR